MDSRPIGVFDSGLGGLTCVRSLTELLPDEDIIYFGDTARVPYGGRSRDTLIRYARQDVAFLRTFDLKAIIIACGTVSTNAIDVLSAENDIPIFGVVEPASLAAAKATKNGRVGLIATEASIRSGLYERLITEYRPGTGVTSEACPLFVPLVENGRFHRGDIVIETVTEEYLAQMKKAGVDTLVLGCTHYPLLTDVIGASMGPDVALIDSGEACARAAGDYLRKNDLLAPAGSKGEVRFFVSDTTGSFARLAGIFLQREVTAKVEKVDIYKY